MHVTQISIGRFHHFHLARQLERHQLLRRIYTGYPRFKLKDEPGIAPEKIQSFPWLQAPYMARGKLGLHSVEWLDRQWAWWAHETLDRYVASQLRESTILIALSGSGFYAGKRAQSLGGVYICDRGSSHIRVQDELLHEEYKRYSISWRALDTRKVDKEESEYEQADWISVPSQFCYDSFVAQGVPSEKLLKIPYGARLERFRPNSHHGPDGRCFTVLFVGQAGPRKGFIDLLKAFQLLRHPSKRLLLIGSLAPEAKALLDSYPEADSVDFLGTVPNDRLQQYYSKASVFVLPSIEEGLGMVIGEAMACGSPVIATTNTGASELICDSVEGFIVPIRSPQSIADRLQALADDEDLRQRMGQSALARVQQLGGWDAYGDAWSEALTNIQG